ncbi:ROK family protein [Microbacterium sp. gxy059]|uniref:ROK family protein n=1 Tax=Microbacterium sp. gxy059 TaxID=2957199 RepID=UPI003D95EEAA
MDWDTTGRSSAPSPEAKLLPTDARAHNRALVLRTVLRAAPVSRADISRITGLSRITVSELVSGLVADGAIAEAGARETTGRPGKPATLLRVNPDAFAVVAVDLSQPRRFAGRLVALDGAALHEAAVEGDLRGEAALAAVVDLVARLAAASESPLGGIGVGSPGIVDDDGVVVESTNLGWRRLALAELLTERFGVPAVVENDVNAAITAELGSARPSDTLLVRIGTGVGGAAVIGGRLVRGANHAGGEIGHILLRPGADDETTVERAVQELVARVRELRDGEQGAETRAELAEAHRRIGEMLGEGLLSAVAMLDVPEVIVQGPAVLDLAAVAAVAQEAITTRRALVSGRRCVVRPGSRGDDVVIAGVAGIVRQRALASF